MDAQFDANAEAIFDLMPEKMIDYALEQDGYDSDDLDDLIDDANETLQAVSYTHLDVYKRQEEFSCLELHMNRDTINWILKKLNTGGRTWSIYQRKSIKTASATRWWETTTFPI